MSMEHFKKRLIHQHQKPFLSKLSPKSPREDGDDDASSNSSGSSGCNAVRRESKKESNMQLKIARQRSVCRSKFRHNSLKIFKLGTSIPTSLCKTKEPYSVCAEKTLQLCETKKHELKKNEFPQKETITEQIINSIEGTNKNEKLQKSNTVNVDYCTKFSGKHNLPAVISEIPIKRRRSSVSRSSEDEQNISSGSRIATSDDSDQLKSDNPRTNLKNYRRKTVTGNESQRDQPLLSKSLSYDNDKGTLNNLSDQIQFTIKENVERISPDSTFAERESSREVIDNKTSPFIHPPNVPQSIPTFSPVKVELPHNTSISTKALSNFVLRKNDAAADALKNQIHHETVTNAPVSYDKNGLFSATSSPIESAVVQNRLNGDTGRYSPEKPINLSVKNKNSEIQEKHYGITPYDEPKLIHLPPTVPEMNGRNRHRLNFPEIRQQLSRLQNTTTTIPQNEHFFIRKSLEERVAISTIEMAHSVMRVPFSVENLVLLSEYYKKLQTITSKNLNQDNTRSIISIINKIIIFVTLKLFEKDSSLLRNYAQRIMEVDLECNKAVLKDVIHLVSKKCYDHKWMRNFFMILTRNERKRQPIQENLNNGIRVSKSKRSSESFHSQQNYRNDSAVSNIYPPMLQMYYPQRNKPQKPSKAKDSHAKFNTVQSLRDPLHSSDGYNCGNCPTDSRYIPPKAPMKVEERLPLPPEVVMNAFDPIKYWQNCEKKDARNIAHENNPRINHSVFMKEDNHSEKEDENNISPTDTVIVKDQSMEVTKGDKSIKSENHIDKNEVFLEKISDMDIGKHTNEMNGRKNSSLDDLHLFKELLKREDKTIYEKILKKIFHVKETVKEVITIDDEEDVSTQKRSSISLKSTDIVVIDDDTNSENKNVEDKHSDCNQNYIPFKISSPESLLKAPSSSNITKVSEKNNESKIMVGKTIQEKKKSKYSSIRNISSEEVERWPNSFIHRNKINNLKLNLDVTKLNHNIVVENRESNLKLENRQPPVYKIATEPREQQMNYTNYQIAESPRICTPPNNMGTLFFGNIDSSYPNCRSTRSISPIILDSPGASIVPQNSYSEPSLPSPRPGANWKSWISEERKKGLLDARQPMARRQSVETISSVGSDYSPNVDHDDNHVKIKIDAKCYRVKKSVMECIPKGKLCYVREKNYLIRYFDDNQLTQFIKNMNISLVSPAASDFLKKIRDRLDRVYLNEDVFITPYEVPEKNEVIQLAHDISFSTDDYISVPELYVEEVEKVERYVPKDFLGFYKYVTGYQIVNNHHPISFQTFLTMHNTNGIKIFYKKYLLSILENSFS